MAMERIDVCIICALAEEADACIKVIEQKSRVVFERKHSTLQERDYFYTPILNTRNEKIHVTVTWLAYMGLMEAGPAFEKLLREFEPRFVAMTGICAGNKKRVKMGDFIVAENTFIFDSGSMIKDKDGQKKQLHNSKTFQTNSDIIQIARFFKEWESAAELYKEQRPISKEQQRDWLLNQLFEKQTTIYGLDRKELSAHAPDWKTILAELESGNTPLINKETRGLMDLVAFERYIFDQDDFPHQDATKPECHIGALASGNAVRRDDPFEEIEEVESKILGLDMEATAIYYALQDRRKIRSLVVKGVSDYADGNKDDRYHTYAATISAVYVATFITQFVNDEYMPWPDKPIITPAQPATSQSVAPSSQSPKPSPGTSATETTKLPVKIVLSYSKSDKDQKLIEEFNNQLTILKRLKPPLIEIWDRHHIEAGNSGNDEIQKKFAKAQIILLIMSPDYYSSDYYEDEIKLIEQCYSNHARVIPILLRDTDDSWKTGFFFGDLQPLPRKGNAVTSWTNRDEVLAQIAKEIKEVAQNIQKA